MAVPTGFPAFKVTGVTLRTDFPTAFVATQRGMIVRVTLGIMTGDSESTIVMADPTYLRRATVPAVKTFTARSKAPP